MSILSFIDFKYFTFQFDFDKNDFIIKKGFFKKTKLSVPLSKIQQINLNQNFIHKMLNLYEIQMDTAGSDSKEVSIKAVDKNIALDIKKFTDFLKNKKSKIEIKSIKIKPTLTVFILLGIGISSPEISWGLMASTGWEGIRSYPHLIIFPCIFIFISTICFLNIGNYIKRKFV